MKRSRSNSTVGTPSFSSPVASGYVDFLTPSPRNGQISTASSFIYAEGEESCASIPQIDSANDFPPNDNLKKIDKEYSNLEIFFSVGSDTTFEAVAKSNNKPENPQPSEHTAATPCLANMRI